jgi:hypothetical protein
LKAVVKGIVAGMLVFHRPAKPMRGRHDNKKSRGSPRLIQPLRDVIK